jgi:hypothetical protein
MKNINLDKSADLLKFKNEMNSVLENRIRKAELNEAIENFSNLSLGDLNSLFESVSVNLFDSENGKKIIGKYVKALKENKELGKAFAIYHIVNSPEHISDVNLFLSETFSISSNINKKKLDEGKKKLSDIVAEAVVEGNLDAAQINNIVSESKEVNSAIDYLITNKKTAKNIYEHVNKLSILKEHVCSNVPEKAEETDKGVKDLSEELVSTLNESELEPWENKAIWDIVSTNLSKGSREELFERYKSDCVNKIDEILSEREDVAEKSRLSAMKQQLEGKAFSEGTLTEDVLNLSKLYHTLSE